jgi:hypothetical protein
LCAQQSPGQQLAPCPQQLVPQQLPGQHFAPLTQQAAPVNAIAESDSRDIARIVISFVFIFKFLSVFGARETCTTVRPERNQRRYGPKPTLSTRLSAEESRS